MSMNEQNCQFEEKTILCFFGELPDSEIESAKKHISSCGICSKTARALMLADKALLSEKNMPARSTAAFILSQAENSGSTVSTFKKKALAFVFAAVIAIASFAVISGRGRFSAHLDTASVSDVQQLLELSFDSDIYMLEEELSAIELSEDILESSF